MTVAELVKELLKVEHDAPVQLCSIDNLLFPVTAVKVGKKQDETVIILE